MEKLIKGDVSAMAREIERLRAENDELMVIINRHLELVQAGLKALEKAELEMACKWATVWNRAAKRAQGAIRDFVEDETMKWSPCWATYNGESHFWLPPHWGRGNHHDGWTPICGANIEVPPWKKLDVNNTAKCDKCSRAIDKMIWNHNRG